MVGVLVLVLAPPFLFLLSFNLLLTFVMTRTLVYLLPGYDIRYITVQKTKTVPVERFRVHPGNQVFSMPHLRTTPLQ